MVQFQYILLGFLVICAISVSFSKKLLNSIMIFMSYSLVMSIIWICLESPDLAITEAAVGAGVTSVLFFVTLKKIHAIETEPEPETEVKAEGGMGVELKADAKAEAGAGMKAEGGQEKTEKLSEEKEGEGSNE